MTTVEPTVEPTAWRVSTPAVTAVVSAQPPHADAWSVTVRDATLECEILFAAEFADSDTAVSTALAVVEDLGPVVAARVAAVEKVNQATRQARERYQFARA
jgi:hypothetical protein